MSYFKIVNTTQTGFKSICIYAIVKIVYFLENKIMAVKNFNFDDMFDFPDDDMPTQQAVVVDIVQEEKEYHPHGEHPIVVLCLDTSGSMNASDSTEGVSRIELVKRYAKDFVNSSAISDIDKERVELCVITFDSSINVFK